MLKVAYLTGSRADFGLMEQTLLALHSDPRFTLDILATGQHLSDLHGATIQDVEASGMSVIKLKAVPMEGTSGLEMGQSVALQMDAIVLALHNAKPDVLLVLGDRGEMLAGALAATFLSIPVAHFHGGERSGTVDDQMRQAITALSQIHFPATQASQERLLKMGEQPENVVRLGAPGLDAIRAFQGLDPKLIKNKFDINAARRLIMCVFHPVVQDADLAQAQVMEMLAALEDQDAEIVILAPNSDAGSKQISDAYTDARAKYMKQDVKAAFHWHTHFSRDDYLSLLAAGDILVGNSSSGIIEAASLKTPAVNIGDRQIGRERSNSVFDCDPVAHDIRGAIVKAFGYSGDFENAYDGGGCAARLPSVLLEFKWSRSLIKKSYTY